MEAGVLKNDPHLFTNQVLMGGNGGALHCSQNRPGVLVPLTMNPTTKSKSFSGLGTPGIPPVTGAQGGGGVGKGDLATPVPPWSNPLPFSMLLPFSRMKN